MEGWRVVAKTWVGWRMDQTELRMELRWPKEGVMTKSGGVHI
jgi:hypothetical protein